MKVETDRVAPDSARVTSTSVSFVRTLPETVLSSLADLVSATATGASFTAVIVTVKVLVAVRLGEPLSRTV